MKELATYEALLFTAGEEGMGLDTLARLTHSTPDHVRVCLNRLSERYLNDESSGLKLIETAETYRLVTKKAFSSVIEKYAQSPLTKKLSKASVETLAVIAYKQPITRMEIEEIRGVQLSSSLQKLKLRNLIHEIGRVDAPGRPVLYGTTDYFLDYFGLNDLTELPELEIEEKAENQPLFDEETGF
ncbi:SMC-Scp complex subunit ScpB [Alkalibacterium kapii]|uniref:Segregation and condensation protein B n=1 Tax=Alkalibacterium kapii TaxID=426704 RepID=A0A511ARY9_9LACT|nr:SMC-Scp complex subunit ScpB [Alkalibacterium kapii]GEK90958.1 segregation and condensation protein B [Alkalibacterium kapii]